MEFIPPKYKEYKDVFEELERGFLLPKHSEDDHEIVSEAPEKLVTGFIYNTNEEKPKAFQVYMLRPRTRAVFILRTSLCNRCHDQLVVY